MSPNCVSATLQMSKPWWKTAEQWIIRTQETEEQNDSIFANSWQLWQKYHKLWSCCLKIMKRLKGVECCVFIFYFFLYFWYLMTWNEHLVCWVFWFFFNSVATVFSICQSDNVGVIEWQWSWHVLSTNRTLFCLPKLPLIVLFRTSIIKDVHGSDSRSNPMYTKPFWQILDWGRNRDKNCNVEWLLVGSIPRKL